MQRVLGVAAACSGLCGSIDSGACISSAVNAHALALVEPSNRTHARHEQTRTRTREQPGFRPHLCRHCHQSSLCIQRVTSRNPQHGQHAKRYGERDVHGDGVEQGIRRVLEEDWASNAATMRKGSAAGHRQVKRMASVSTRTTTVESGRLSVIIMPSISFVSQKMRKYLPRTPWTLDLLN
ncbi:hypothetical protein B0H19DRAFT_1230333 [Mycena capillaripes]|nr:hypothetical protein B0H19DRAFT_1230333 [Mycena capillaripes]